MKSWKIKMYNLTYSNLKSFYEYVKKGLFVIYHAIWQKKETLIKVLLPLVVILFGYLSCSHSQQVVKKNIQNIFLISDAIRSYYADKPGFWLLNTEYALKQGMIPDDFIKNDSIVLKDNIKVLIGSGVDADAVMPTAQSFDIILPNLNKAQCISYAESELSETQKIKIISISIANTQGIHVFEWGDENGLPISKYATQKLCLDKNNTLVWSLK